MLGKDEMKKMGPSILIALGKKKGMSKDKPMKDEYDEMDTDEHMEEIASDLIDAIESKDVKAVAELLKEAMDCSMNSE